MTAPTHGRLPTSRRRSGLKPYNTWPKGETGTISCRRLNARLKQLPGFSVGISQPIIDMVYDVIGGAHSPLVIRIIGDDFNELRRIGDGIVKVLNTVPGHRRSHPSSRSLPSPRSSSTSTAQPRRATASMSPTSRTSSRPGWAARPSARSMWPTAPTASRCASHKSTRNSPEALGNLVLTTSGGTPDTSFAGRPASGFRRGETTITHEMGHRELLVRVDNRDRALSDYLSEAQARSTSPSVSTTTNTAWSGEANSRASSAPRRG